MQSEQHTFTELELWAAKMSAEFGRMAIVHVERKIGHRIKVIAYVVAIIRLLHALKMKIGMGQDCNGAVAAGTLRGVDDAKADDLMILLHRTKVLLKIVWHHFAVEHPEIKDKIEEFVREHPDLVSEVMERVQSRMMGDGKPMRMSLMSAASSSMSSM